MNLADAAVAGLLAGYGIAMPVGAVATYLVSLTARTSPRVGAAAALGVATADGLYALIAVLGGAALTELIQAIAAPLRWASVAALVAIAARIVVVAIRDYRHPASAEGATPAADATHSPGRAFATFLGITLLNPATVIYFAALVVGSRASGAAGGGGGVFVVAAFVASASWQLLLVAGGTVLARVVTGRSGRLLIGISSGSLILALTAVLVLSG